MGVLGDARSLEMNEVMALPPPAVRMLPQSTERSPLSDVGYFIEEDDIDTVYELQSNASQEYGFAPSPRAAITPPPPSREEPYDLNTSLHFLRQAYVDDDVSTTAEDEEHHEFHAQHTTSLNEQEMLARHRRSIFRGAHQVLHEGYVTDESDVAIELDRVDATLVAFMLAVKVLCVCTVVLNVARWLFSFVTLAATAFIKDVSSKFSKMVYSNKNPTARSSRTRRLHRFPPRVFEDYIPHDFNFHDDFMMMNTEEDLGQVHGTGGDNFQHPVVQDVTTGFAHANHQRLAVFSSSSGLGMWLIVVAGLWSMARLMLNIVSKKRRQWRDRQSQASPREGSGPIQMDSVHVGMGVERRTTEEPFGDDGGWGILRERAQQWLAGEDVSMHTPRILEDDFNEDVHLDGFLACPTVLERRIIKSLNSKLRDYHKTLRPRDFVTVFTVPKRSPSSVANKGNGFNSVPALIESWHSDCTDSTTSGQRAEDDELQGSLHSQDTTVESNEVDSVVVDDFDTSGEMKFNLGSICPSAKQLTFCLPVPGTRLDDAVTMGTADWQFWRYDVPPVCAICLCPYEEGDVVAWSSNIRCQHVFHKDCITAWFLKRRMPGSPQQRRRRTDIRRMEVTDDDDAPTPCPYCRHDFIVKQES